MAIPAPVLDNKAMVAKVTTLDGDKATDTTVAKTPDSDSYVEAVVDGEQIEVGDGVKTKASYFSVNGGTTARNIIDIAIGDTYHWNGSVVTYELDTNDRIDFNYIAT